jgi:pilus assembly protein CpaE
MYPLSVILVGCDAGVGAKVRRELAAPEAPIEAECADTVALSVYERSAVDRPERWTSEWGGAGGTGRAEKRRLYIIQLKSAEGLYDLRWLTDNLSGHPALALVDGVNQPFPVIDAVREGAAQVVLLPLQTDDFQAALHRIARQFGPAQDGGEVIAVCGVTGGSGGSTVAVNLALELSRHHPVRCLLVELAQQMGSFASYLSLEPEHTTREVFADVERHGMYAVKKAITRYADNLDVLAAPYDVIAPAEVDPQRVLELIECARRLADVVVLDVPCTFDALFFHTLQAADQLVLVAEQRVMSLRTLKLIRDALTRAGMGQPQHLVVNRYDPKVAGLTLADLAAHFGVTNIRGIHNDWAGVSAALNQGRPLCAAAPLSPVLSDIEALARQLRGLGTVPTPHRTGLLQQLRRAIGFR